MSIKAYYTLIQFIADPDRDERVNLAVILQCPEYNYAGMEIRRGVEQKIHCLFPQIDSQLIRYILEGFKDDFDEYSDEPASKPIFNREQLTEMKPTWPEFLEKYHIPLGQIVFRETSPIFLTESQGFNFKLKQLAEKVLDSTVRKGDTRYVTKNELKRVVEYELTRRHIHIIKNPPKYPGKRWPNSFDALKERGNRRWLQFISYRQSELPVEQTKAFIASVVDMRASERYPDDEWACILKEPLDNASRLDKETFESAIKVLGSENIAVFTSLPQDIDRLARGLESPDGLKAASA